MNKLEFIARQLDRTKNKSYENYVINRIYTLLNNTELKPVTQQYVRNTHSDLKSKYFLLDLYFPQINKGVEVDEAHHKNELNIISDEKRSMSIYASKKCEEYRIDATKSLEEVNAQIDEVVANLKNDIANHESIYGKISWKDNDELLKEIAGTGILDVDNEVNFGNYTNIANTIFGLNVKGNRVSCSRKDIIPGYKLWVPFLAKQLEDGTFTKVAGWSNILSHDYESIIEKDVGQKWKRTPGKIPDVDRKKRIVFMKMTDEFDNPITKFIGVYENDMYLDEYTTIYKRVSKDLKIR